MSQTTTQKHNLTPIQNQKKRNYHPSATMGNFNTLFTCNTNTKPKHRRKLWQKQPSSTKPNTVIVSE